MNKDILAALAKLGIDPNQNNTFNVQRNANEVMNTANAATGGDAVPGAVLAQEVFDAVPNYATFLGDLPGNHGTGLNAIETKTIIGDPGFFQLGAEQTTGALAVAQGQKTLPTDKVTITQKKLEMTIDISDELNRFNTLGAEGFQALLKSKMAKAAARTIEAAIVNGDTTNAGTGNVNLDDANPADTLYYLGFDGLRKAGLAATSPAPINVGSFDQGDLLSVANLLGDYFAAPEDCLWLFNRSTYNKALGIQAFYDASQRGEQSTLSGKALTNILGSDLFVARDMPKTEADGKVSTTASNNTLGQFLLFWKPAVQYGFGNTMQIKLFDLGKDGYQLQAWFYFGYGLVQKDASITDSSVGVGYNVTL